MYGIYSTRLRVCLCNFGDFPIHKKHTFSKYGFVCPFFSQNGTFSRAKIRSLIFLARKVQNSVFHHDKSKEPRHLLSNCACCVRPRLRWPPLWFALAKEALLDGFAVFYQTIPSHRGAYLPLLGITLFSAGISFIIRVL